MFSSFYFDDRGERRINARRPSAPGSVGGGDARALLFPLSITRRGFVLVVPSIARGVSIVFDASTLNSIAAEATCAWLQVVSLQRVALVDRSQSKPLPEICDRHRAIEALRELAITRARAPRFHLQELNIKGSYFGTRWEAAQEILNAGLDLDTQSHILSKLFQHHFVLTERDPSSGHFVLAEAGAALDGHTHIIGALQIGRPFTVLEDHQFGAWIADGLRAFRASDRPIVQQLDIRLKTQKADATAMRYTRLVIPYHRAGRDQLMTAAIIEGC